MPKGPSQKNTGQRRYAASGSIRRIFMMEVRPISSVVNHYNELFGLNLSTAQKSDLVEFLKSL